MKQGHGTKRDAHIAGPRLNSTSVHLELGHVLSCTTFCRVHTEKKQAVRMCTLFRTLLFA